MKNNFSKLPKTIIAAATITISCSSWSPALGEAQDDKERDWSDSRDGAQSTSFTAENFSNPSLSRDTDFGRHSYSDALDLKKRMEKRDDTLKFEKSVLARDPYLYGIRPFAAGGMLIDSKLDLELANVRKPILEVSGDWVPDKIDLTNNGGFEVSPDNGSPVPYRLNGHVDIQRGRPWDINN